MKSCILAVIKNEQTYLDEWIRYHLDLGIDHIFIFEDIDSDSHEEIASKYSQVTLDCISTLLNSGEVETAIEVKRTKRWNVQHLYFRKALNYVRQNAERFDWCFIIDADEFLTLKNKEDSLRDVLSLYNDYDAIVMQWKCFGANGYIHQPDYTVKGVVDTYTREIEGRIADRVDGQVKTCHNLNSYKEEFFFNQHHPSDKSNWCNTAFKYHSYDYTENNIYVRHYITKSWEEYVWKRRLRGYSWGKTRDFNFFFIANPDLRDKRKILMDDINPTDNVLVVLPYKQRSSQGQELKIALNGWKRFCQFNYHFVVIGEFDDELRGEFPWVEFIYQASLSRRVGQYTPHLDIMNKFNIVMQKYCEKYSGLIYVTDDEYAIKPFAINDIMKTHHHSIGFVGQRDVPTSFWNHDKWKTRQLLDKYNLPHINYTTHFPYYVEFDRLKKIIEKFNLLEESYVFDDIYFNYFSHEEPTLDSTIRLGVWNKDIYEKEFDKAVNDPNIKFVCNSVEGWSKELEESLKKVIGVDQSENCTNSRNG